MFAAIQAEQPAPGLSLQTENLGLQMGGVRILDDVSLSVGRGELVALIGPNGAGKTSLLNVVTGLVRPSRGRVLLDGLDATGWSPHRRVRAGLARTFQTSSLFATLTVRENVRLAVEARLGGTFRMWRPAGSVGEASEGADRLLQLVGLSDRAKAPAGHLSHGEKRQLELALVLAGRPGLLLLDEPMAGLNAGEVPRLAEVIRSLPKDWGATVLMVEHHLPVVMDLAHRVAVMHHGTLLAIGQPEQVIAEERVQVAYLGEPL